MGIGPSTKETSLHHFRDPLLDVVSSDEDLDLMGIRGIPVTGLKFSGTVGQFVVENDHLGEILDINKSEEGIETDVLGENNVTELDAKKVTAMLKLKMRKNEKR